MPNLVELLRSRDIKLIDVAKAANVDKATVSRWARRRIPAERVVDVERITGIPRHELRPDIFGAAQ